MASHGSLLMYAVLHVLNLVGWPKYVELVFSLSMFLCFFFFFLYVSITSCAEMHLPESDDVVIPICTGEWLCLKNVHLVVAWLPVLENSLRGLSPHPSFRLLLTSESHPAFPASLLEACLKVHILNPKA